MNCGGIGALHLLVQRLGLVEYIDQHLHYPAVRATRQLRTNSSHTGAQI